MRKTLLIFTLGMTFACRSSSNNGPDAPTGDGNNNMDAPALSTTVKGMRMNQPTNGTMISLTNVVVVAHVTSKKYGHLWVQDQGGGMYSGIQLFCNYGGTKPTCSGTQAQYDGLAIGSVINVTGAFSSFLSSTAPAGAQPLLEVDTPVITMGSGTMTPVAVDVPAATIAKAQLTGGSDPYKGAYVHVTGATTYTASSIAASEFATSCTDMSMPAMTGATFGGFEATGGSATLAIGFNFYKTVTYCLPCTGVTMPYPCTNAVTANETFTDMKGIIEPSYKYMGTDVYLQLSPTADTDMPHS